MPEGRELIWIAVNPRPSLGEPVYLYLDEGAEPFRHVKRMIDEQVHSGVPIVSRELEVAPEGLETVRMLEPASSSSWQLEIRSLELVEGSSRPPSGHRPSCLPVAITMLRSFEAGRPVVLLRKRARFANWNDFDKVSLFSAGLLEEDLAYALDVPVFADREASEALDAMWKAYGRPGKLPIPLEAFVRGAQRNIFASCGLDLAAERYIHRGCHLLERDRKERFLFFCVFEVTLQRHGEEDELRVAKEWDPENLILVAEEELFLEPPLHSLNRFLVHCQEWIETEILAS
jgi:hypothetical protein